MGHIHRQKDKLLHRIARLRGQLDAVASGIETDADCTTILQSLVSCRGAVNALVVEMFADHVRNHVVDPKRRMTAGQNAAADEMIDLLRSCI